MDGTGIWAGHNVVNKSEDGNGKCNSAGQQMDRVGFPQGCQCPSEHVSKSSGLQSSNLQFRAGRGRYIYTQTYPYP